MDNIVNLLTVLSKSFKDNKSESISDDNFNIFNVFIK